MKNSTLKNENLKAYTALAGAFLATGAVNGQVMYTDVNPDAVVTNGNSFAVDFDGDATDDFLVQVGSATGTFVQSGVTVNYNLQYGAATGVNGLMGTTGTSSQAAQFVSNLSNGNAIGASGNFVTSAVFAQETFFSAPAVSFSTTNTWGNFVGATDAYIGVSFDISGSTHYGWVRCDVASDATTVTIKDYAYDATAGTTINAGDMGSAGLDGIPTEDKVNFKTLLDHTVVNVTPDLIGSELAMVDLAGNTVSSVVINDVNTTVQYNDLKAGIYMVVVKTDTDNVSKKVYVK